MFKCVAFAIVIGRVLAAAAMTCGDLKKKYKDSSCCGSPNTPVDLVSAHRPGCNSQIAQKMTSGPIVGGTLYAYDPQKRGDWMTLTGGKKYVDLAQSSIAAGCVPKHKPHMVLPSPDGKHTAITYTGDTDFAILQNDEHKVLFCPNVDYLKPSVFGGATHTGAWYGNDHFLLLDMTGCVDSTCGGGIYKFKFMFDEKGTMDRFYFLSALGVSGVAAARKSSATKPIALGNNPHGAFKNRFFVTDAKAAGSILDAETMEWVKHFEVDEFGNCSGGGLWVEPHPTDEKVVIVQYGKQGDEQEPGASCIFNVDLSANSISKLVQLENNVDAHGLQFCRRTSDDLLTVINTNRQTATLDVINYADGSYLLQGYDMNANVFNNMKLSFATENGAPVEKDMPLPDKLQPDVVYLHNGVLYMAARGPKPVSAVKPQNAYENAHPGMMALMIDPATCLPAQDQSSAFALTCLERSPAITSDVHSVWGVLNKGNMEIWTVDQAGTGSVQTFHVYSACPAEGATGIHKDPPFYSN